MRFAHGLNNNGREIGYGVKATCDLDGCEAEIDRGFAYCCGGGDGIQNAGMEDEPYCGGFFCAEHLFHVHGLDGPVCSTCLPKAEELLRCPECKGRGHDDEGETCERCDSFGTVSQEAIA